MRWDWVRRATVIAMLGLTTNARAQEAEQAHDARQPKPFRFSGEIKFNFRDSVNVDEEDEYFERTTAAGGSLELSNLALTGEGDLASGVSAKFEIHVLDLYNRNPTSTDDRIFVREAWVRFHSDGDGDTARRDEEPRLFLLVGQAPRFSKQRFRRLESYGLWGTAVGRFEERQVQAGGAIGSHAYWRASVASANALFFRDPNALAGDNGASDRATGEAQPVLHTGFPILYDAKASDLNFNKPAQWGAGGGARWIGGARDDQRLDVLGWYFQRRLADAVPIRGTSLSGDLALLRGNGDGDGTAPPLPTTGRDKIEWGANIELARGGFRLFGQGVHQDIAGLVRRGYEIEAAYVFDTHSLFLIGETPALNWIQPVLRVSSIDNRFAAPEDFPTASVAWNWRKYDLGLRIGIVRNIDLTAEFNRNIVIIEPGETIHPNEGLLTLRIGF
jgi:hypothetical protein